MSKLVWDKTGERFVESGISHVVFYPQTTTGYGTGVAWNGVTSISESPDGADANDLWADNIKYASLRAAETLGLSIEAYTYPEEFSECDGTAAPVKGLFIGQQKRKSFGLCYRTEIANDTMTEDDDGYKLHLVYNCTAAPSERSYETMNDSPDAITFSWDVDTLPEAITGYKPTALITIDSLKLDADGKAALTTLENMLYGTDGQNNATGTEPTLPSPDKVLELFGVIDGD